MTAQPLPEKIAFGDRYWLTSQIAIGGMAEIYLARQSAMSGFEKDVVIKRLRPELARDKRIVEMFLDEARIGAVLNHPNIVHVYDVDHFGTVPYIAMEYIPGEELNVLCRRGIEHGKFLPLEHAVELIRQAAAGMGYFHARRDAKGRGLDIVHCDISPSNLLVTEDGSLKIIDFGIAKARNQRFRDENAIPGKLSYMSPEQARRERLDHRSDIFSLGVVLYEITVGKRLFKGPAHEVVNRVIECEIKPPTFVRRDFPGHLESIIMRTLEAHPQDRFQSAFDLADELEDFLREAEMKSGPVRIARYLDELAHAGGGQRRPELVTESEKMRDDDALDFDREVFDSFEPSGVHEAEALEWDEFEESEREVAAALGIDPELMDPVTRTPVPHQDEAPPEDEESEPEAETEAETETETEAAPEPAPKNVPVPVPAAAKASEPKPVKAAPVKSESVKPAPTPAPPGKSLPWVSIGTGLVVFIAGLIWLLTR
jgi:serine/threonine protein kinase